MALMNVSTIYVILHYRRISRNSHLFISANTLPSVEILYMYDYLSIFLMLNTVGYICDQFGQFSFCRKSRKTFLGE